LQFLLLEHRPLSNLVSEEECTVEKINQNKLLHLIKNLIQKAEFIRAQTTKQAH
jgi:hypothetical protein